MQDEFLYRGFNCEMEDSSALKPKSLGGPMETGAECGDERVQCGDSDFTLGLSVANTIHSHEYGGNGGPTSGLSTTPCFDIAKKYALGDGEYQCGTVLKFSKRSLLDSGVKIYRISDIVQTPAVPDDDEHWIWFENEFPVSAIVERISVQ